MQAVPVMAEAVAVVALLVAELVQGDLSMATVLKMALKVGV